MNPLSGDLTNEERNAVLEEAARMAQQAAVYYSDREDSRSCKAAEVCASNIRRMKRNDDIHNEDSHK